MVVILSPNIETCHELVPAMIINAPRNCGMTLDVIHEVKKIKQKYHATPPSDTIGDRTCQGDRDNAANTILWSGKI
jgi:hypothetical protein